MATVNIFELKERFRQSVEYLWRYRISACLPCTGWKLAKFEMLSMRQVFTLPLQKENTYATWNLTPKCPPSTSSRWGKDFKNRLNTFGDIGFWLAPCTGWKWQNFKCCRCAKFSPCHCKSKIPAHLKLSTQMATVNIFELWERFRQSVEYLWRYRISARTVYRLKVAKFQMLSMRKVFTLPLQK